MRGFLRQVKLFDFLQFLDINGRQGILSIDAGGRKTQIFFGRDGVRLLSSGRRRRPLFGEILLRWGRLGEDDLAQALEEQRRTRRPIGEILARRNAITTEDVEACLRTQVAEEICDAISDEFADFEFSPTERAPDEDEGFRLTLNGGGIVLEAARRVDEWRRVRTVVASFAQIYRLRKPVPEIEGTELPKRLFEEVAALLDGGRCVNEVIVDAGLTKLETCRVVALFKEREAVRPMGLADRYEVVARSVADGRVDRAVRIAENFLFEDPLDVRMRVELARLYVKQHYKEDAYREFRAAAERLARQGFHLQAVDVLKEARRIYPERLGAQFTVAQYLLRAGRVREAAVEGVSVADLAVRRLRESRTRLIRLAGSIGNVPVR